MATVVAVSHPRRDVHRRLHLLSRRARRFQVAFIEEALLDEHGPVRLERSAPQPGVTVCRPRTLLHAPGYHDDRIALVRSLLSTLMAGRRPVCCSIPCGPRTAAAAVLPRRPLPEAPCAMAKFFLWGAQPRVAVAAVVATRARLRGRWLARALPWALAGMTSAAAPAAGAPPAPDEHTAQHAERKTPPLTAPRPALERAPVGPAPVAARHHGGLYRISGRGGVAYLFGTIHVGHRSFYPLAPEAERALAGADHVVVELDPRGERAFAQALARHGRYAEGDDIGRHVSSDTLMKLRAALHAEGVSLASVMQLKPWLIANLLLSMKLDRQGFRRSEGVEQRLLAQARRRGARVVPLESAELQLGLFDSMNDIEAERYLRDTLTGLADGSALERARRTIDAWRSGNAAALDAVLLDATGGGSETAEFTRRKLLGRRNADMAAQIDTLVGKGGVFFIGVGLLHLLGDNGLPQLLAQRGYLIERVY